jgi:phosphoribosyl-AMP cyclohydrolase
MRDLWSVNVAPTDVLRETKRVSTDNQSAIDVILNSFTDEITLIPVIAQDAVTNQVLMLAWMNRTAFQQTIATKRATYWSRSRSSLWVKGETSGNIQELVSLSFDCDADSILIRVTQHGPACHTGQSTCFHNSVELP